jgi:hypothetical protein
VSAVHEDWKQREAAREAALVPPVKIPPPIPMVPA